MRANEIIRSVLDLIDTIENSQELAPTVVEPVDDIDCNDETRRFDQIIDLLNSDYQQMYDNSPAEAIASIEAVTSNAGGGWNGPKNPADMRADSISMYPNYLHKPGA